MTTMPVSASPSVFNSTFFKAVALASLAVGVLDATDGVAFFWLTAGLNPIQVLQFIANGALGASAYDGGLATAAVGVVFPFGLAFAFTAAFALLMQGPRLERFAVPAGLAWGALVWALMNLVVLPLSNVGPQTLTPLVVVHGVVGHALFVGLTAALVLRRTATA
jgi:hypothetical protein